MSLKQKTIKGIKWSTFARGTQQLLQLVITAILARLLLPEDFGILSMAVVFTGLIAVFNDFGIGSAVIQKKDLTNDDLSSIFWFNLLIGFIATLITIIISPLVARFYNKHIMIPLLSIMSLGFILESLFMIQKSILTKRMDFKKIAMVEIVSIGMAGIVAITLAYKGYGVWSLVFQQLTAYTTMTILFWITLKWLPELKFNMNSIKSIMGFSLNLMGFSTVNYFSRNVDYLLIGRFLGAEPLGYYTLAYRLMLYPLQNISSVITRVLFPAFSSIQDDDARFRNAYLRSTRFIAFITFPIMFGAFAVADELIIGLFGPKWAPAIFLFKILCFVGMMQSIGTTVGQIYLSKGRTDWIFRWSMVVATLMVLAIFIGLQWKVEGVAVAYALLVFILAYPNHAIPFKLIGLKVITFVKNLKAEFFTSLMMFIFVYASVNIQRFFLIEPRVILISNVLLGMIVYILVTKIFNKDALQEIQGMVWRREGGRASPFSTD